MPMNWHCRSFLNQRCSICRTDPLFIMAYQPVKRFLSELPVAWDDTKLLAGYPGEEVILARRKGDVWYIGGINGTNETKTLHISLDKIAVNGKKISIFKDGIDDKHFAIEENIPLANVKSDLTIECLPRGGFVAVIK